MMPIGRRVGSCTVQWGRVRGRQQPGGACADTSGPGTHWMRCALRVRTATQSVSCVGCKQTLVWVCINTQPTASLGNRQGHRLTR
eukprot:4057090-Ditylum_brightwellii.AAC.1